MNDTKQVSKKKIPDFLFEGKLSHTVCNVNKPFSGELTITRCAVEIKSIELQLVRVESCCMLLFCLCLCLCLCLEPLRLLYSCLSSAERYAM
jgi:hypothetical protein